MKTIIIGVVCGVIGYNAGRLVTYEKLKRWIKSDEAKKLITKELEDVFADWNIERKERA